MLASSDPFLRVTRETISLPSRHNSTESGPESERAFHGSTYGTRFSSHAYEDVNPLAV
jgi:hypothetical protein